MKDARPGKKLSQGRLQKSVIADANERKIAPARAMRWVAASAFFELLNLAERRGAIDAYLIKGGFAVELRHPDVARTSEDIDLVLTGRADAISLLETLLPAQWDSFSFGIKSKRPGDLAVRVDLQVQFNTVDWCTLKLDVLDADIREVELVDNIDISKYQLPRVTKVACLSRPQQMSEWIHCTTKLPQDGKRKNRARNIIDIYVLAEFAPSEDRDVVSACESTFAREGTHDWPPLVRFPEEWSADIEARLLDLDIDISPESLIDYVIDYIGRIANATR